MSNAEQSSRLSGFYQKSISERLQLLRQQGWLAPEQLEALSGTHGLSLDSADHMIENVIGVFGLPLGLGLNFQVNGRDVLVPMAVEEPSVVAGASFMAKLARAGGGFSAQTSAPEMIGQIQVLDLDDVDQAAAAIEAAADQITAELSGLDPILERFGGGYRGIQTRPIYDSPIGPFLVLHLIYDVRDAMGANAVNTACEHLTPTVEQITGGRVHLRILSNLADRRLVKASCRIPLSELAFSDFSGEHVRDGVIEAWAFAAADPYRAATHNKGIMNGIDPIVIATGNDWRAIEAGAHAYAARSGRYTSLTTWSKADNGDLLGQIELPMAVGTVGGATRVHPAARPALDLMGIETANQLAEVIASVGLAQNLAALRALATEGIQRGHMSLHARQVAISAGAEGEAIGEVARRLIAEKQINAERAAEILGTL
jgi:hydroxymethylglutaryl-CoA reductase